MIRVASVPSAHVYVRHGGVGHRSTQVLPDPQPAGPVEAGRWWPPRWLEPDWVRAHVGGIDLLHVHFGFETSTPDRLREVAAVVRGAGVPLVVTVHDLHNPHFADPAAHRTLLGALLENATEVLTLTSSAAQEIRDRWRRTATVVPHPHVVPLDRVAAVRRRGPRARPVIGVDARRLRANLDPVAALEAVLPAALAVGAVVRVQLDDAVADPRHPVVAALSAYADDPAVRPAVELRITPRRDDETLWDDLEDLDLAVLPYRFGTHSGWLEACVDLGTPVLVPTHGCYADQLRTTGRQSALCWDTGDPAGTTTAVRRLLSRSREDGAAWASRRRDQRDQVSAAVERTHRRALDTVSARTAS